MTGGSVSRSAGILSRSNELERLNRQIGGVREQLAQGRARPGRGAPGGGCGRL